MHEELNSNQLSPIVINLLNGYGTLPSSYQMCAACGVQLSLSTYKNNCTVHTYEL
jgi:hypothetical protein